MMIEFVHALHVLDAGKVDELNAQAGRNFPLRLKKHGKIRFANGII